MPFKTGKATAMRIREALFSTRRSGRIKRHVVLWTACFIYLVAVYPPNGYGVFNGVNTDGIFSFYEMVFIRTVFSLVCQMLFCYPLLYILMPRFFWKKRYLLFSLLLLLLWFFVSVFRYAAFTYGYNPLMERLKFYGSLMPMILWHSFRQTFSGPAFISFIFICGKIFKDWQQKQADNFALQKEAVAAELQLLKAQIHPHFLFNTLNNIYAFTLNKSPQAKGIVKKLEAILHYMIEDCVQPLVPLKSEIKIIQDYFDLERIRYGNSLDMEVDVTGDFANARIAPLLMIPFVENSFKHGTSKILRNPWIKLFIQADENMLHFTLTNSKPAGESLQNESGIGLNNVKKRLDLLYPGNHLLLIEPTTNTFTVNMQVPLERVIISPEAIETASAKT